MLQTQTVEAGTLDLIKTLMKDAEFSAFNLVGGTALSLILGHRKSIDIDLFTIHDFDAQRLAEHLSHNYHVEQINTIKNGIFCFIENVKLDVIAHQYPILYPPKVEEGIRMLSVDDIGAMKLNAILNNGSRLKDFIDMYFLLERVPLGRLTTCFEKKYPDVNKQMAHAALLYHQDINTNEKIELFNKSRDISLKQMDIRFRSAIQYPNLVFKRERVELGLLKKKVLRQKKDGRGLGL